MKKGLDSAESCAIIYESSARARHAAVAQLDRVTGYEPVGRGFESLLPYQENQILHQRNLIFLFYLEHLPPKTTALTAVYSTDMVGKKFLSQRNRTYVYIKMRNRPVVKAGRFLIYLSS